ncbi:MAG: hypothetical protein A2072_07655 [Nitrospirae bacterium GWC1_57_7]|nr:MAG: hypothetical protein A2072_07655 [Nitrospirae bacterium GWC1_57_7]
MKTTLDKFGRLVVPKDIRDRLGLRPGDEIEIEEHGREVVLKPADDIVPLQMKDGVLVFTGASTGDIEGSVSAGRDEHIRRLSSEKKA